MTNRRRARLLVLGLFTSTLPPALLAQSAAPTASSSTVQSQPAAEPSYPQISIGTLTYIQYDAELENRNDYNAFDLTRGYINITGDLARNIKFRLTPDLKRITDGSLGGSLTLRLKYGFVELDNLGSRGSWLRFGLHQTPWLDFEENINRYRVQGTMFSEREAVIPGSGDFGVGYFARLPNDYGEIQTGIYNGEGFTQAEADKAKSFQGRITVRPLPDARLAKGFRISAFYDLGWYNTGLPRRHGIVMGSFEHPQLVATLQWLDVADRPTQSAPANLKRRGYSGFLEVRQGLEGWAGLVRFDHFDPNEAVPDDSTRRLIGGAAYWLKWEKVRLGLVFNDEDVRYGRQALRLDENRLLVQTHVQF